MLSVLLSLFLAAVSPQLSFTRYTAREGFPQQPISGIAQDSEGHILISAGDLFSFDGYNIKKIKSTFVNNLYPLSDGRVAAVTGKTVRIFSSEDIVDTLRFDEKIKTIAEASDGRLWCVFNRKIVLSGERGEREWQIPFEEEILCAASSVGKLYLGTTSGNVIRFDPISSMFTREAFSKSKINCLLNLEGRGLFVGTKEDGLFFRPVGGDEVSHYFRELCSLNVLSLCEDVDGNLWVGTIKGLNLIREGKVIGSYKNESDNETSLSHNTIRRIFRDSQGGMWLGTFFGGVNYWHPSRKSMEKLVPGTSSDALNDVVASCMEESADGRIWIGTNQGGINCYDPSAGRVVERCFIPKSANDNVRSNDVKAIYHHPDGRRVFVGIYENGLNVLDRKTGKTTHLTSPRSVVGIEPIDENRLLLLSYGPYYSVYEIDTDRCKTIKRGFIYFLFRTSGGLFFASDSLKRLTVSPEGELEFSKPSVPAQRIVDVCETIDSSALYVATKNQLFKYDLHTGVSSEIVLPDEFPNIVGLVVDNSGDLWISTMMGLYCFSDGYFLRFLRSNGLVTDFYSQYSRLRSSTGKLYFGGVGGVSIIDPEALKKPVPCPDPEVSSVVVSGKKLKDFRGRTCTIRHPDRNISLTFSAPDYASSGMNIFEYKLVGIDDQWCRAGTERRVDYSHLPRGRYVFSVRVSRHGDVWTTNERALDIRVRPAWYATVFSLVLWLLLVVVALVFYVHQILRRKEIENKLALGEIEKKYAREISKLKVLRLLNSTLPEGSKPVEDLSPDDERFLTRAMTIVEMNINRPDFSTDELALGLALSRSSLHKYMKSATGDSALAFIHKIRFSRACELLEKKELTISEICYKTGFSSPAYFSASFRKYMGCSPQEYQKRFQ